MKKIFALMMICLLALATGCGGSKGKVGTIQYMNATEKNFDDTFRNEGKHVFFDNLTAMVDALKSKQIDSIRIYERVGNYISANNPNMEWEINEPVMKYDFCFALRKNDSALKKEFDAAILSLKKNGAFDKLVETYINAADFMKPFPAVEMPHFDGAPTIKIAVTGDLPPFDCINPDGKPAGFDTAFLAEISKLLNKNFELVHIGNGERAAALTSNKVDVIFLAVKPNENSSLPADFDTPDGVTLTMPYFAEDIVHVKLRK